MDYTEEPERYSSEWLCAMAGEQNTYDNIPNKMDRKYILARGQYAKWG
jgi:hypothetical protein